MQKSFSYSTQGLETLVFESLFLETLLISEIVIALRNLEWMLILECKLDALVNNPKR